jgi:hypothetical protein
VIPGTRLGVKDDRFRKPVVHQLRDSVPSHPIFLATSPQRASPEVGYMVPEHMQCMGIGRHGVVVEVAAYDPCQPFPLCGDRVVHALRARRPGCYLTIPIVFVVGVDPTAIGLGPTAATCGSIIAGAWAIPTNRKYAAERSP